MDKIEKCVFCNKDFSGGQSTVVFSEKGSSNVNQASEKRGSAIRTQKGQRAKKSISNVGKCLEVQISLHLRPRKNIPSVSVSNVGGKGQNMLIYDN